MCALLSFQVLFFSHWIFGRPAGHMGPQLAEGVTVGEPVDNGQTVETVETVET